jgi:cobalt-zinc-cadmium efflux system membrane fusion protein
MTPGLKKAANKVIKLGAQFAASHGIADEPAKAASWARRASAYGRVVPNPRAVVEVRAPFAGTLRPDPQGDWPTLGSRVKAGQVLGRLEVRFGPQERLDLVSKLKEARLKQQGAEELTRVQQARFDRFRDAGPAISQAELDSARTQLTEARTQLDTASAAVKEWQAALEAIDRHGKGEDGNWTQALTAPAPGEVSELLGRPGMAVEPGTVVARLVDFRHVLVRLEIPPEVLTASPPTEVELTAGTPVPPALSGGSNRPTPAPAARPLTGRLLGTAPQVEVNSQFSAYWYEVDTQQGPAGTWRPGLFVKAAITVPGAAARPAVSVPETALLYHDGRALVYVTIGPGRYERREVEVLGRDPSGRWVLAAGVETGEPVVSQRAQVLLSEEFRADVDTD